MFGSNKTPRRFLSYAAAMITIALYCATGALADALPDASRFAGSFESEEGDRLELTHSGEGAFVGTLRLADDHDHDHDENGEHTHDDASAGRTWEVTAALRTPGVKGRIKSGGVKPSWINGVSAMKVTRHAWRYRPTCAAVRRRR